MLLSRYYTVLNLLVLSVVIYSGVDVFYTIASSRLSEVSTHGVATQHSKDTTTLAKRPSFNRYLDAINRDLFGVVEKPAEMSSELQVEDLERTALNITLLGTVSGDSESATAVIQEGGKRTQALYKEGDTVQNATITKILRGKVILRVGDKNQILTMGDKKKKSASQRSRGRQVLARTPPRSAPGTTVTLDRSIVAKSLENISELISQVRVRPHYKNGQADGLMLSQVRPNTLVTKMGLRNGDVIQSVNGEPITSPDDIVDLYEELRSGSSMSLEITRRGKNKTLTYRFR